jgi:hypothetical protein
MEGASKRRPPPPTSHRGNCKEATVQLPRRSPCFSVARAGEQEALPPGRRKRESAAAAKQGGGHDGLPPPISSKRTRGAAKKKKRGHRSRCGNAGAAVRKSSCGFDLLAQDCRVRILGFLGPNDLADAAMASRQLREDCRHESLPQGDRTAVVRIPEDCPHEDRLRRVGSCLIRMAAVTLPDGGRKFHKFPRLRVLDPQQRVRGSGVWDPALGATIPEITALDWSGEEEEEGVAGTMPYITEEQELMASMLPNVREVDFSLARGVCRSTFHLEKATWHRSWLGLSWCGYELRSCESLRELYVDGSCLEANWRSNVTPCLLRDLSDRLERVSIKDAHYAHLCSDSEKVSQATLIEFVRNAPNLRWFRSDLTAENAAMLQAERPNVTFAA